MNSVSHSTAPPKEDKIIFLLNPWLWFTFAAVAATIIGTRLATASSASHARPLTFWEEKTAQWFLMNATVQFLMDGLSVFHAVPGLHDLYYLLDARYAGDPTVDALALIEAFVMAPLCISLYFGVHARAPWRHGLQLVTSAIQFMGTLVFIVSELYAHGGKHWMIDYSLTFSAEHLAFFWFSIVFGMLVWLVIPPILMIDSIKVTSAALVARDRTAMMPLQVFPTTFAAMGSSVSTYKSSSSSTRAASVTTTAAVSAAAPDSGDESDVAAPAAADGEAVLRASAQRTARSRSRGREPKSPAATGRRSSRRAAAAN